MKEKFGPFQPNSEQEPREVRPENEPLIDAEKALDLLSQSLDSWGTSLDHIQQLVDDLLAGYPHEDTDV